MLYVFAHPDDAEYFCGGCIISNSQNEKNETIVCCATREEDEKTALIRKKETINAFLDYNVKLDWLEFCDGQFFYDRMHFQKIKSYIDSISPDIIITHNQYDYHNDHRILARMVFDASSYRYPVLQTDTINGNDFTPELFVDITNNMEKKLSMLSCHSSQLASVNYIDMVKILNLSRGLQYTGKTNCYCEAFGYFSRYHANEIEKRIRKLFCLGD